MLVSERGSLATKTPSHEAAQRKTLWTFVSWCLSGEILLNTLLPHYFLLLMAGIAASAQTNNGPALNWIDTTRDVYVDNELDRGAQVLTSDSPSRLALLSAR